MLESLYNKFLIKSLKKNQTQVFYCEYCEIFKNTYFKEHLLTTAYLQSSVTCICMYLQSSVTSIQLTAPLFKKGQNSTHEPESCNFIKKETLVRVFSYEFCEISKNTFLPNTPGRLLLMIPFI